MGMSNTNKEDLVLIKELLETAEAIRYLETEHARGKVIITVE
jgi:hypothetical protein